MIEFDDILELMRTEDRQKTISSKGSMKNSPAVLAFKHEMDRDRGGYNAIKEEALYDIHHVPNIEKG